MVWFKNAVIYQLNNDSLVNKDRVENAVKTQLYSPCSGQDNTKMGFVSPYHDSNTDDLVIDIQGHLLLRIKKETKILPSSVVKQALLNKIDKQELTLNRRLTKTEKASLKDEVMIDLLPRAFSKYNYYWFWIDTENKRVVVDCSSFKQAEDILAILRKALGTLALTPLSIDKPLEQIMTTWVKQKLDFSPLILGDEAELKDPLEGNGIIRCKNQDITSDEMLTHINLGKWVTKIKVMDERGLSFIVNSDLTFKRIKFDSIILDENEDITAEESDKRIEADFTIMAKTLSQTITEFCAVIHKIT